jgi:DinB superfamily
MATMRQWYDGAEEANMAKSRKKTTKSRNRTAKKSSSKPTPAKSAAPATPSADSINLLRQQLAKYLETSEAHASWRDAFAEMPPELRGAKVPGSPHTAWQMLEHLRIAQWDIVGFSRDPKHVSPDFPAGYWPAVAAPPDEAAWDASVRAYHNDAEEMRELILDPKTDLFAKIPNSSGKTILREALLLIDHNAYHLGQLVLLRRLLDAWPTQ